MDIENIKESLKRDFNRAVEEYNSKEYIFFYRDMRVALENLTKLMLADTLGNEMLADELISGTKNIISAADVKNYTIVPATRKEVKTGSRLFFLFADAYCFMHKDKEHKHHRKYIKDQADRTLKDFYEMSSATANHAGSAEPELKSYAQMHALGIHNYLKSLATREILSDNTLDYIGTFSQFVFDEMKGNGEELNLRIQNLLEQIEQLKVEHQKEINEKVLQINQQKAELLQAVTDKLEADRLAMVAQNELEKLSDKHSAKGPVTQEEINGQEQTIAEDLSAITNDVANIVKNIQDSQHAKDSQPGSDMKIPKVKKKRFGMKERVLKEFNVGEDSLDSEQIGLIERELNKSMIVAGCAGSGKSVIAMYKAQQIIDDGGDVILIAYTKSLNRYMQQGKALTNNEERFYYHWQWKDAGRPSADYIIVDEIQDFSKEEVYEFINAARKCFFFFGDSAQSIYGGMKETLSISDLSTVTGIDVSYLTSNYRLPKPVAKITQEYVGIDVSPYADAIYQSKEIALPHFVRFDDSEAQIDAIIQLIGKKNMKNVGILVPDNEQVLSLMKAFTDRNFACEFKYNAGFNDNRNRVTLDFSTQLPKLMTYHSAKGLQFETVILPFYVGATAKDSRKALYVAMTRTYRFLYVLYRGSYLQSPLQRVPEHLYLKTLD